MGKASEVRTMTHFGPILDRFAQTPPESAYLPRVVADSAMCNPTHPPCACRRSGASLRMGRDMLHHFIVENRSRIIERTRQRARERTSPRLSDEKLEHGVPIFLDQLVYALAPPDSPLSLVGAFDVRKQITDSATLHGRELLKNGFTIAQAVHGYGDVCQVVTELAAETNAAISAENFQVFNRCLDDAIAGAVTAYQGERERAVAYEGTERLGVLSHELRNLLHTAILSFDVIKKGLVGVGGSTGAVHQRSLASLRALVDRSLTQVRLEVGMPVLERIVLAELMEEIELSASMHAEGFGHGLKVESLDTALLVDADRQLLSSAISNLLQNAFKFSRPGSTISLAVRTTAERVLIDVSDACGGLPPGKAEEMFRPFAKGDVDRSGLGLGLGIALSAARANDGDLTVRDVPGTGCVFTIDLPRPPPSSSKLRAVEPAASAERRDASGACTLAG